MSVGHIIAESGAKPSVQYDAELSFTTTKILWDITSDDAHNSPQEQPKAQRKAFAPSLRLGLFNQGIKFLFN